MKVADLWFRAAQKAGLRPPWYADLVIDYRVSPETCVELGRRSKGRRPLLPSSMTCRAVSGVTWEELWAAKPRKTEADIFSFYREIGAWSSFRQAYYHRWRSWGFVAQHLPQHGLLIEYGCGIAPASHWIASRLDRRSYYLTDVRSEHFLFGLRRMHRLAAADPINCAARFIRPGQLPRLPRCEVALLFEVLEHVPSPLAVIQHVGVAVKSGGVLIENFYTHAHPTDADLVSAERERPAVYAWLDEHFRLVSGRHWDAPHGGGTRTWRLR